MCSALPFPTHTTIDTTTAHTPPHPGQAKYFEQESQGSNAKLAALKAKYVVPSRSTLPRWGSIRFRLALRTYAPWGVRVVSQTKSRKIPTRNISPLFAVSRYAALEKAHAELTAAHSVLATEQEVRDAKSSKKKKGGKKANKLKLKAEKKAKASAAAEEVCARSVCPQRPHVPRAPTCPNRRWLPGTPCPCPRHLFSNPGPARTARALPWRVRWVRLTRRGAGQHHSHAHPGNPHPAQSYSKKSGPRAHTM